MRDLKGKVAVVTGGGSGIGFGTARALSDAGMNVVIADLNIEAAEAAAAKVTTSGTRAMAVQADVSSAASMIALADRAYEAFGEVHVLMNNAGVAPFVAFDEMSDRDWQWILSINLFGVINGVNAFLPRFRTQAGEKHIVNTSSMAGLLSLANLSAYSATKAAVISISETLRQELAADHIGVSVLCPGLVRSNLQETTVRLRPDSRAQAEVTFDPATGRMIGVTEVGAMVRRGIEANEQYIFTHAEWAPLVRQHFAEMLDALDRAGLDDQSTP